MTRSSEVTGEARIREPLAAGIGAPTLTALAVALEAAPGWEWDGETFTHALDGGQISYDPVTRELEIIARVSTQVEASGEASTTVSENFEGTIESEGEGVYYDDGWGGITEADAHAEAERAAAAALDDAVTELRARRRAEADAREGDQLEADAVARAEAALATASAARRAQLQRAAAARLTAIGVQGRNLFHAALADAYRDAILAYARSRGADGIRYSETDGVLEIEFEMPA